MASPARMSLAFPPSANFHDVARLCAKSDPRYDFMRALGHVVRADSIYTNSSKREGQRPARLGNGAGYYVR